MASWTGLTRVRVGIAAVIILIMASIGYLVPRASILNEVSVRDDIISRLSAWAGGAVQISGPYRLSYFPGPVITTGGFIIESSPNLQRVRSVSARGMTVELGLWSLLSNQPDIRRIVLVGPHFNVATPKPEQKQPTAGAPAASTPSLVDIIRAMPVPEVSIVEGKITVSGPKTNEKITKLNADATVALPSGAFTAKGNLMWREQPVAFDFASTAPDPLETTAKSPIKLTLSSPLISADVKGKGNLTGDRRVAGSLDLRIGDLRRFARWLGLLIPDGEGLGGFLASGKFHWQGHQLGFDEGTYTLDGNKALGTLEIDFSGVRPAIGGTLAFSAIDLAQYRKKDPPQKPAASKKTTAKKEKPNAVVTDFPLLHHLDLDLRMSTNEIIAPPLSLGQVALSVAVKSGRLIADFAILDLCSGTGNGRLTFDASVPESEIRLTANIARLAARGCVEAILGESPIAGDLDITADLSSKGRTGAELLRYLGGKVIVDAGRGEIGLDLAALKSRPAARGISGWRQFGTGATPFSEASAELIFRQGTIFSDSLEITSGASIYSGEGTVNLLDQSIDLRLAVRDAPKDTPAGQSAPDTDPVAVAFLTGSWLKPGIEIRKTGAGAVPATAGTNETRTRQ